MSLSARGLFAAAALACVQLSAQAADPKVVFTFDALNSPVSVSRDATAWASYSGGALPPGVFLAAYSAVITNDSTNTINNFRLRATSTVVDGSDLTVAGVSAPFVSEFYSTRAGVTCVASTPTEVACQLGQFRSGDTVTVTLAFKTPLQLGSKIKVAAEVAFGEGTGDSVNAAHKDGSLGDATTLLTTASSADQQKELLSFIPSGGASFYTGNKTSSSADLWTTEVTVPGLGSGAFTTVDVNESPNAPAATCIGCSSGLTTRLSVPADLSLPRQEFACEVGKPETCLQVTLRRDSSTTVGNVRTAPIYYLPEGGLQFVPIYSCSVGWATPSAPCVLSREEIKANSPDIGARKDWVIKVLMKDNGRVQM